MIFVVISFLGETESAGGWKMGASHRIPRQLWRARTTHLADRVRNGERFILREKPAREWKDRRFRTKKDCVWTVGAEEICLHHSFVVLHT